MYKNTYYIYDKNPPTFAPASHTIHLIPREGLYGPICI